MNNSPPAPRLDFSFPHDWHAEVLSARPAILPARHHTYPRQAEEIERGALEVLVRPGAGAPGPDFGTRENSTANSPRHKTQPFLATCALGFRDPAAPTGLWSMPHPAWLCAVSGGYAYLIDTNAPERFTMLAYRPVLNIRAAVADGLLLFASHQRILAWGRNGQSWETEKLSDEGIAITAIEPGLLRGLGWQMRTDKETPFTVDLRTGIQNFL